MEKIQLPEKDGFEKDCKELRWHQLVEKYGASWSTIKVWKKNFGLTDGKKHNREVTWVEQVNGCWACTSHKLDSSGYPQGSANLGRRHISRVVYEQKNGKIPKGMVIRHKCDNTMCVNPDHLQIGTKAENSQDMVDRNRQAKGEECGASKFTEQQVLQMYGMKGSVSQRKVARMFGTTQPNVQAIWSGRTWSHLTGCNDGDVSDKR